MAVYICILYTYIIIYYSWKSLKTHLQFKKAVKSHFLYHDSTGFRINILPTLNTYAYRMCTNFFIIYFMFLSNMCCFEYLRIPMEISPCWGFLELSLAYYAFFCEFIYCDCVCVWGGVCVGGCVRVCVCVCVCFVLFLFVFCFVFICFDMPSKT